MRLSVRQFARAYLDATQRARVQDLPLIARRFIEALTRRRQRRYLSRIVAAVERMWNERHGIVTVAVTTAVPVDVARLSAALGEGVELSTTVDPNLIGGAVIERGDERIDGSVRSHLLRLRKQLSRKT